jgi:tripeptide aminopeptidase
MTADDSLPGVAERFLRYVKIDTRSDPDSETTPSTEKQKHLSRLLFEELRELGVEAEMDRYGYVYGRMPSTLPLEKAEQTPVLALLAHVDTSPDEPGGPVEPLIHRDYDGGAIALPGDSSVTLDPRRSPELLAHVGQDLITSDGTTLLGSDDKAGVAIIMQLVEELLAEPEWPRPELRVCFTVDEEIGRGVAKLDLERLGADVAYTLDGGPVGDFDTETFNASEARIRVKGVMVHPGTAKDVMVNAGVILSEILVALPSSEAPETTEGREGYFCAHRLEGGIAEAEAKILLRDFDDEGLERRKELVRRLVEAARVKYPRAELELEITDTYRNMKSYIEDTEPRTISLAFEAAEAMGLELTEQSVRGGTDGARLSELGLPTPNVFTGGHDYHSRFEWNTVQNLERSLAYTKQLVRTWAEQGREG